MFVLGVCDQKQKRSRDQEKEISAAKVEKTGLSFTLFGSFALSGRDVYKDIDELDLTVQYAFNTGEDLFLAVGFTHYGWYFADHFTFKDWTTQNSQPKIFLFRMKEGA